MAEESLWVPIWRENWRDTGYLLPDEQDVWEAATDAWVYKFPEIFGYESPFAFVQTAGGAVLILPEAVAWHAGIGPPDQIPEGIKGRQFMQLLTQIRIPILFRTREAKGYQLKDLFKSVAPPGPLPDLADRFMDLFTEATYMFIFPVPYADADTASKFLAVKDYFRKIADGLPHRVNFLTSRIVCFEADEAIKERLVQPTEPWPGADITVEQPLVLEIPAPEDYWEKKERYG